MLDSMCRQMSTKAGCRRWPLVIFFNILDIAGINAWIIFRKTQASCISRQKFLRQLTHRSNVVSKQSNSSANLIVFNNESTWQNSQLSSEVSRQTQQNHHNVWRLQTTGLWQVHNERLQAVQGIVYLLLTRDGVLRQLTLAAVLGIHSSTGVLASPNAFLHSFLKRLYKIRKSQFLWHFCYNSYSEEI